MTEKEKIPSAQSPVNSEVDDILTNIFKTQSSDGFFSRFKNWSRSQILSLFAVGNGCCAREVLRLEGPHRKSHAIREKLNEHSIEESDILIVSGVINKQLAPYLVKTYERMKRPRYCIAVGACAATGSPFQSIPVDQLFPVDVYIMGCPPTLDAIVQGVEVLRERVKNGASKEHYLSLEAAKNESSSQEELQR